MHVDKVAAANGGTGAILKYAGNNLKGKFRMDKYDYYKAVEDDLAEFI